MAVSGIFSSLHRNTVLRLSPWFLVGSAAILGLAIAFWAVKNAQLEREHMSQNLTDRAGALIWAMEAGARTGVGMNNASSQLQSLLEETAKQPGILFMAVVTEQGQILAHSDRERIGEMARSPESMDELAPSEKLQWRIRSLPGKDDVFEVYKTFLPLPGFGRDHMRHMSHGGGMGHMRGMMGMNGQGDGEWNDSSRGAEGNGLVILIGLDVTPFETALTLDVRNTVFTAVLVGLLGLGGFVSLFWAQSYRLSRRLLQDTRAFAAEVVTSLPIGLIIGDAGGTVTQMNAVAARILGCPAEAIMGQKLTDLQGLDWSRIAGQAATGTPVLEEEHTLAVSMGNAVPVSISASRICNEEGLPLGTLFLLRDLREVKRLQEQLRRSERLSALGNMAARVAHEIRNPLSSIKGYATYLGTKHQSGEDKDAARIMIGEVDRLNRVVSELLDFARPSNLNIAPADVHNLLERALRLAGMDAESKGVAVRFVPSPESVKVAVDAERITQAMLNLFLNAIQATEAGGALSVSVTPEPAAAGEPGYVRIEVTDTGCGMAADVLPHIFNPYFTTRASGTGLGLAITQKIIEDHLGAIQAASITGQGTTITVRLPLAAA